LRLLLLVCTGGGGATSSVAGGQDPVLHQPSWCHREAGVKLLCPSSSRPSHPLPYRGWSNGAQWVTGHRCPLIVLC